MYERRSNTKYNIFINKCWKINSRYEKKKKGFVKLTFQKENRVFILLIKKILQPGKAMGVILKKKVVIIMIKGNLFQYRMNFCKELT